MQSKRPSPFLTKVQIEENFLSVQNKLLEKTKKGKDSVVQEHGNFYALSELEQNNLEFIHNTIDDLNQTTLHDREQAIILTGAFLFIKQKIEEANQKNWVKNWVFDSLKNNVFYQSMDTIFGKLDNYSSEQAIRALNEFNEGLKAGLGEIIPNQKLVNKSIEEYKKKMNHVDAIERINRQGGLRRSDNPDPVSYMSIKDAMEYESKINALRDEGYNQYQSKHEKMLSQLMSPEIKAWRTSISQHVHQQAMHKELLQFPEIKAFHQSGTLFSKPTNQNKDQDQKQQEQVQNTPPRLS